MLGLKLNHVSKRGHWDPIDRCWLVLCTYTSSCLYRLDKIIIHPHTSSMMWSPNSFFVLSYSSLSPIFINSCSVNPTESRRISHSVSKFPHYTDFPFGCLIRAVDIPFRLLLKQMPTKKRSRLFWVHFAETWTDIWSVSAKTFSMYCIQVNSLCILRNDII